MKKTRIIQKVSCLPHFFKRPAAGRILFFAAVFLLAASAALFGTAESARAQTPLTPEEIENIIDRSGGFYNPETVVQENPDSLREQYLGATAAPAGGTNAPTTGGGDKPTVVKACFPTFGIGGSGIGFEFDMKECVAQAMNLVLWVVARLLWIAGVLMNFTLNYTLNLHALLENLPVVEIGWKVIRDLSNIVFIFIALWCGISITLGAGDGKRSWGLLAQMVLVALFVNFSLFITQAVVDASNVAALHFYNLIGGGNANNLDGGLSSSFMQGLRLQTLWNTAPEANITNTTVLETALAGASGGLSWSNIIIIGVFGSALMAIAAWVFFAATVMFIFRTVTLIFLMILSPLAFVGWILPGASGMVHEWWHKLWSQSLFAPLFLALAYIVVATINSSGYQKWIDSSASANTSFAAALTGVSASNIAMLAFNFTILIALMVGCLIIAQSLGAKGSAWAMSAGKKLGAAVGGSALRTGLRAPGMLGKLMSERIAHMKERGKQPSTLRKGLAATFKWADMRYLDERFKQTRFGQWGIGKVIRESTTGALARAKIGEKSLWESYEEAEKEESVRKDIRFGNQAKEGGEKLNEFRETEGGKRVGLHAAQKKEAELKLALDAAETKLKGAKTDEEKRAAQSTIDSLKARIGTASAENANLEKELETWLSTTEKERHDLAVSISKALAEMSAEGFLNLPKHYFSMNAVMDQEVLGSEKYNALMASEHFTELEKKEYTKARTKRIEEESGRAKERNEWFLKDMHRWRKMNKTSEEYRKRKKEYDDYQTMFREAQNAGTLFDFQKQWKASYGEAPKEPEPPPAEPAKKPKLQRWETPEVYKALRNMRNPRELINFYRYNRPLIDSEPFVQTVSQGMWNKVRDSEEVDSGTKEKFRVDKRLYLQEASDFRFGLDPIFMKRWEQANAAAAQRFRNELNRFIQEHSEEDFYDRYFRGGELTRLLEAVGKNIGATDAADSDERFSRNETGKALMYEMAQNLADNEFNMMPGTLRNLHWIQRILNRATFGAFKERDQDVKIPDIENLLRHFANTLAPKDPKDPSKGFKSEVSRDNLDFLVWLVNERSGKEFVPWEQLSEDAREIWEVVKAYAHQRRDAQPSVHTKEEAAQWLRENGYSDVNHFQKLLGLKES